jgi:hypothetical protein
MRGHLQALFMPVSARQPERTDVVPTEQNTDDDGYTDLRQSPRRRVLKSGVIAFNGRHCTLTCTVRDISGTGARIRVQSSVNIPDHFDLIIEMDGIEAECEVMWRRGSDVGVRFKGEQHKVKPRRMQVVSAVVPHMTTTVRKVRVAQRNDNGKSLGSAARHSEANTWASLNLGNRCDAFLALLVTLQPETVKLCTLIAMSTHVANALVAGQDDVDGRALIKYFPRESAALMAGGHRVSRWYRDTDLDHTLKAFQHALAKAKAVTLEAAANGLLWRQLPHDDLRSLAWTWQSASRLGHGFAVELDRMLGTCGITGATDEHSKFLAKLKSAANGSHSLLKEDDMRMPLWAEQRGFERSHLRAPALLRLNGRRRAVIVRDISVTGLGLECDSPLAVGLRVSIEIGKSLAVAGSVIWSDDRRVGVQLDTPLQGDDPMMAFSSKF